MKKLMIAFAFKSSLGRFSDNYIVIICLCSPFFSLWGCFVGRADVDFFTSGLGLRLNRR